MDDPASATVESGASDWEKAVQSGHCPICFLLQQDEFHRVCRWVGGDIADEGNRRGLDEAGGFCNWHFWLLNEIHSPQSGSVVNDYIAARLVEWLRNCAWQAWQAQAASLRERATRCPLCAHVRACESAHVRSFVGWVSDGLAWSRYVESRGLCLPHLVRCQALVREEPLRERLNGAQIKQMERLQDEMRELVGKLDRKSVV